jgi:hypothetical protein
MTEQEWLACTNPYTMQKSLRGKASPRKFRLFAAACCRSFWHLLVDARSRRAVEIAVRLADGEATEEAREAAYGAAWDAWSALNAEASRLKSGLEVSHPNLTVEDAAISAFYSVIDDPFDSYSAVAPLERPEIAAHAALLRDLIGPLPFRPVCLDPSWLTWQDGLLISMAQPMYDSRDFNDMPILADALEDAGCSDEDILKHCRRPGEHVRGCWVVDMLLGRS